MERYLKGWRSRSFNFLILASPEIAASEAALDLAACCIDFTRCPYQSPGTTASSSAPSAEQLRIELSSYQVVRTWHVLKDTACTRLSIAVHLYSCRSVRRRERSSSPLLYSPPNDLSSFEAGPTDSVPRFALFKKTKPIANRASMAAIPQQ